MFRVARQQQNKMSASKSDLSHLSDADVREAHAIKRHPQHIISRTREMAVTPQDAAREELKSVAGFGAVLAVLTEIARNSGFDQSPAVQIMLHLIAVSMNVFWQIKENGGTMERWDVKRQLGRIGINGVLLLSGIAIYGIFLWAYGIHNTDQLLQKLKITKNSNPMDVLFLYVSNALVYSFDRLLVNGLLILIAMLDYMIGG